jgi:hypothetical protein
MATALTDLRRRRRTRRLGDTEWFDLAYHVYLAGIFGGSAIIIASDYIGDEQLGDQAIADAIAHGPAVLGLVAVLALIGGLRSGSEGGPVSIEAADVVHLLLAPVQRAKVLRRPLLQRLRAVVSGASLAGGVAGLLTAQRLPGGAANWTLSGAAFGACVATIFVAAATIAHSVRLPGWGPAAVAVPIVGWQVMAITGDIAGPGDSIGSLALWGFRRQTTDLLGVAAVAVMAAIAIAVAGRLLVEHLARRGDLVSQLRFAVTMQDLRTVVLLRRQLREEQPRTNPWVRLSPRGGRAGTAVALRGLRGLLRTPAARFGRMLLFAATAGVAAGVAARGSTAAVIASGILVFVIGLDLIEPLSQEIDHPDRTLALPVVSGWTHERLLIGSGMLAIPVALVGATTCTMVAPASGPAAFTLAIPILWSGMSGAVINTVRDDLDPGSGADGLIVPPEMAGFRDLMRTLLPVVASSLGTLSILAVRSQPDAGMVMRCLFGLGLYIAGVRWWIVHRTDLRQRWRTFTAGARP